MNVMKPLAALGCAIAAAACLTQPAQAQIRLWGTYYGGFFADHIHGVVTDGSGNVYVAGSSQNALDIATPGAFDVVKAKLGSSSGLLAKFDTNGKRIWSTFYGDEVPEPNAEGAEAELIDVKLDFSGNVYVIGNVECPSQGLATPGAFQRGCKGGKDLYLAKFSPNGKRIWGTYYGGDGDEKAGALSVTSTGVYLVASTQSSLEVVTAPSHDFSFGGETDGLIAKFDLSGKKIWARYFGGEKFDSALDIDCKIDVCFVAGVTESETGIATAGAHDIMVDAEDAFVARINGANGQAVWGTYFGGDSAESGARVIVDPDLNVYVGGTTYSDSDVAMPNAFKSTLGGISDNFLAKFDGGGVLKASTYFGEGVPGSAEADYMLDLARDAADNIYAFTAVYADGFELMFGDQATQNAFDKTIEGGAETVITKFGPALNRFWSTYYGGSEYEPYSFQAGITIGLDNHIHVVGDTVSPNVMATPGAHKTTNSGLDGFIAEFAQ